MEYQINPKAFINAHNFPHLDALVAEVKRIDSDERAYEAMRNEPIFLHNFNPKDFYATKLLSFFENIFAQGAHNAFRRGDENYRTKYAKRAQKKHSDKLENEMREKLQYYESLGTDALNLAKFYYSVRKSTRKFRHKLKFWRTKIYTAFV
ncbi:hypothetical protein [Helicobacter sp. 23-1045]